MKRGRQGEGGGRKWFDGKNEESVISLLSQAWALGCSDCEAATLADISTASLSGYLSSHPEVAERKERLKHKPFLSCRNAILKQVTAGDGDLALKYLERKLKAEFGPNVNISGELAVSLEDLISGANDDKKPG